MEIFYQVSVAEQYNCGACPFITHDVKILHDHVSQHTDCGSFFFCNDSKVAYPRQRPNNASTQTELLVEITSNDIIRTGNSLRFMPEVDISISKAAKGQEQGQVPVPGEVERDQMQANKDIEHESSPLTDDISDAIEEIDNCAEIETSVVPRQEGDPLVEIPLSYKYMSNEELLKVLLKEDLHEPNQSRGNKNYIVIATQTYNKRVVFDDGVSWDLQSRKSTKRYFSISEDYKLSNIFKKGLHFYQKRFLNRRTQCEIIHPQPIFVICFKKTTVNLEANSSYRRRITTVLEAPEHMKSLTTKSVVEYYMDLSSVKKVKAEDNPMNITIPDCNKLKELLYPGISKNIPEELTSTRKSKQSGSETNVEIVPSNPFGDIVDSALINLYAEDMGEKTGDERSDEVKQPSPTVTGFHYLTHKELLKVIIDENIRNDEDKNYRVFSSNSNGFQNIDEFGVWKVNDTSSHTFSVNENNEFTLLTKKGDKFYTDENCEPLSPQPINLLVLQKCTFKLEESTNYKKRETILWSVPERMNNLLYRHVVEYCSENFPLPREEKDESGKTKLVFRKQILYPREGTFQSKLSSLVKAGMLDEESFLQVSNSAYSYMTNNEILETMIIDGTTSQSKNTSDRNYMVIRNEKAEKKSKFFLKDGCVWNHKSGTSVNQMFSIDGQNNLKGVVKKGDTYFIKKSCDKKITYVAVDPQPTDVITFHKYWTQLKSCSLYKKRVTSVIQAPERLSFLKSKVLIEYYMSRSGLTTPLRLKKRPIQSSSSSEQIDESQATGDDERNQGKRKFDEISSVNDGLGEIDEGVTVEAEHSHRDESAVIEEMENTNVRLPITDEFLSKEEYWQVLSSKVETPVSSVLSARDDKDYILVSSDGIKEGVNNPAYKDGLIWNSAECTKHQVTFVLDSGTLGQTVSKLDGVYCLKKIGLKNTVYEILEPQPKQTVSIQRIYYKLKGKPCYKKRIIVVTDVPDELAFMSSRGLVEYGVDKITNGKIQDDTEFWMKTNMKQNENQHKTPRTQQVIEDVNEIDAFDEEMEIEEDCDTRKTSPGKLNVSLYRKTCYSSPNLNRSYRSERLKSKQNKRLKLNQDEEVGQDVKTKPNKTPSDPVSSGSMMNAQDILNCLITQEPLATVREKCPDKSFVVVEIKDKVSKKRILRDKYYWNSKTGTSHNQLYSITDYNELTLVIEKDGMYCTKQKVNNKIKFIPLKPQPHETITLHRYFVKEMESSLMKRHTSITECPERLSFLKSKLLVEYATSVKGAYLLF